MKSAQPAQATGPGRRALAPTALDDGFPRDRDAFPGDGDAFPGDGDASGAALVAFPTPAEHPRLLALTSQDTRSFGRILGPLASQGKSAARAELHAAEQAGRLLDSSLPISTSGISEAAATANARAPWELLGRLWPVFESYVATEFSLVSLSLTAPPALDIRLHAAAFVRSAMPQPREGALMVVDRRDDGSEHFHGIAILADPAGGIAIWCRLTGARAASAKLSPITGWEQHVAGQYGDLLRNVAGVMSYAFKPWPPQQGYRRPREDVIACGVLAPVWEAVLPALYRSNAQDAASSGVDRRSCQRCGRAMPRGKRSHAKWCSATCRKAAGRDRRRESPVSGRGASRTREAGTIPAHPPAERGANRRSGVDRAERNAY